MNVAQFQHDVADILDESIEEGRKESVAEKPTTKIKKLLNSPPRGASLADGGDVKLEI